jgi:predicted ABC-class ATPase
LNKLRTILQSVDGKGYKAYKNLKGTYEFQNFVLCIDHIQGDPFASPSKVRLLIPRNRSNVKPEFTKTKIRKIYCEDLINRTICKYIKSIPNIVKGTGKSGMILIDQPGQEILERSAVVIDDETITVCLSVGLPAQGRRILAKEAGKIFFEIIPSIIKESVLSIKELEFEKAIKLCDQQYAIRQFMENNGYVAFIANGSILPRESGVSDRPMRKEKAVPFQSPKELEIQIPIPHQNEPITGMGIRKGITLIVGGGYHGKSTLLKALERGVYNHIRGDGREFVFTDSSAYKIRAEDGRKITNVNISPFINHLPFEKDTIRFSTDNASGSTSQAANIVEAIEAGAKTLLIDEDTSATNFMIRDERMRKLVKNEPITPFIDKAKQLYEEFGVSTILVIGGSGAYFDIADCVIQMDHYVPVDVTEKAKELARLDTAPLQNINGKFGEITYRIPLPQSLNSKKGKKDKVSAKGKFTIQYGHTIIDLHNVEQLVDESQTNMIAEILQFMERERILERKLTIPEFLTFIEQRMNKQGLASFTKYPHLHPGELARPRTLEIAAALNRLRTLVIE